MPNAIIDRVFASFHCVKLLRALKEFTKKTQLWYYFLWAVQKGLSNRSIILVYRPKWSNRPNSILTGFHCLLFPPIPFLFPLINIFYLFTYDFIRFPQVGDCLLSSSQLYKIGNIYISIIWMHSEEDVLLIFNQANRKSYLKYCLSSFILMMIILVLPNCLKYT
jgi:hypothetical protein